MSKYKVLTEPLTYKDVDENGWVEGVVPVDFDDVFRGFEEFLDLLSALLVNSSLLMDISYSVVGVEGGDVLHVLVSGDASAVFEEEE